MQIQEVISPFFPGKTITRREALTKDIPACIAGLYLLVKHGGSSRLHAQEQIEGILVDTKPITYLDPANYFFHDELIDMLENRQVAPSSQEVEDSNQLLRFLNPDFAESLSGPPQTSSTISYSGTSDTWVRFIVPNTSIQITATGTFRPGFGIVECFSAYALEPDPVLAQRYLIAVKEESRAGLRAPTDLQMDLESIITLPDSIVMRPVNLTNGSRFYPANYPVQGLLGIDDRDSNPSITILTGEAPTVSANILLTEPNFPKRLFDI